MTHSALSHEKQPQHAVNEIIRTVRGQRVILDSDLAHIYGVETKILNKAFLRNPLRFPEDFVFRLTKDEADHLRFQFGTSNKGRGGRRYLPWAFTEHGAIMAATVLNSPRAVEMSVFVVRAFVRLRQAFLARNAIEKRLDLIEKTLLAHDSGLRDLYDKLRPLLLPPPDPPRKSIGFGVKERRAVYRVARRTPREKR